MKQLRRHLVYLLIILLLAGCATLRPDFEEPAVTVTSFRALPTDTMVPKFEIGLHIVNPNRVPLELFGISYNIELEGHRILTGVASDMPLISAYGEGDVLLKASPDLFSTLRLFTDLMSQPRETFRYGFTAKLDVGTFLPRIKVEQSGEIELSGKNRQ
jgi:LEA14-like dessication related protein